MTQDPPKSSDASLEKAQDELNCVQLDGPPRDIPAAPPPKEIPEYVDDGPPDGGVKAWTQAVMAHLIIFNTWGYICSYGAMQAFLTTQFDQSPSDISWVGSIQVFLIFFIGTASGRATDAGLFLPTALAGLTFQLVGVFTTSVCKTYWQLLLAQGLCLGIGHGLIFCPAMALIPTYFSRKRSFALAIAASGSATGGMIYPTIVRQLLSKVGFGWTFRVVGFIMLAVGLTAITFMRTRLPPRKTGALVEWTALREPTFLLYCIGMFLSFWSIYFAFYYVSSYAREVIGLDYQDSISLILLMNGISIIGRVLPAYYADTTFGPLNTMIPFAFISGVVVYGWAGVNSRAGLYAFSAIYGLMAAPMQSLFPAALSSLTTDLSKTGARLGMGFTIVSFATLTGPPLGGVLVSRNDGNYLYAQMWAGSSFVLSCIFLFAARKSKAGWKLRYKI